MTFYVKLIELFQLPATPVTSEDDKKRPKRHLAVSSLNKCNAVRATAAAIARGKRNLDPVLAFTPYYENQRTKFLARFPDFPPDFHLR